MTVLLSKRQTYICYDSFGNPYNCNNSNWNYWGRWVFLAVAIVFIFLVCVAISCISARRRRRMGRNPYYGTGWAANHGPWGNNYGQPPPPPQNNPNTYYAYQQPAPPYHPGGYQREQQSGIELATPDHVYEPPVGPPPKKNMY